MPAAFSCGSGGTRHGFARALILLFDARRLTYGSGGTRHGFARALVWSIQLPFGEHEQQLYPATASLSREKPRDRQFRYTSVQCLHRANWRVAPSTSS